MIFLAVGTQKFQFNRLLSIVDSLIASGDINEEVFAQTGHSDYIPQNYGFKDFLSKDEFETYVKKCDLLIAHSGVATIITGLKFDRPVIVVPRLAKFGEHVDDHQLEIAKSFAAKNFILMCEDSDNLNSLIDEARVHVFDKYISRREKMIDTIREYIHSIQKDG